MAITDISNQIGKAFRQIGSVRLAKAALTVLAILAVGYLAKSLNFEGLVNKIAFSDSPSGTWYQGRTGYLLLGAVFTTIGGPRQIVAFFGAYFFGLLPGLMISTLAAGLGCLVAVLFARLFESRLRQTIGGRIDFAFGYWRQNPISTTLIIRLLPVGSNLFTNLAAGIAGLPVVIFVLASMLGYLPQMAVFALMGSGVDVGAEWQIGLGIALFIVSMLVGLWLYGRYRRRISR